MNKWVNARIFLWLSCFWTIVAIAAFLAIGLRFGL
jgi:hypothetical protein